MTKIYCSDLTRARQTAEVIAKELFPVGELHLEALPSFREMKLGAWDGRIIEEIREKFPEDYAQRGRNLLSYKIDLDSENYYDLRYRAMKQLNRILEQEKDQDIILVAHAGVNAVIRGSLEGLDLGEAIYMKQDHGGIHIIEF